MATKKTLLVINDMSGNSGLINTDDILRACAVDDEVTVAHLVSPSSDYSVDGFDKLIVCGGDGTINNAINKCSSLPITIFYYPTGTLNERAKTSNSDTESIGKRMQCMGIVNRSLFSYVVACGAFTEIGYTANPKDKKKFKALAYLLKVLSAYKVYDIGADIVTDTTHYNGKFSLIMVIDSNRCFGFRFNRAYKEGQKIMHLLTIKTVGKNNFWGKVKMFFPFFRVFFIGFNRAYHSKYIDFLPAKNVEINLENEVIFDIDGERRKYDGFMHIQKLDIKPTLYIMKKQINV